MPFNTTDTVFPKSGFWDVMNTADTDSKSQDNANFLQIKIYFKNCVKCDTGKAIRVHPELFECRDRITAPKPELG